MAEGGWLYGLIQDGIVAAVGAEFRAMAAYSSMIFNLLCAPCFAAMGAIKREMNNAKWTAEGFERFISEHNFQVRQSALLSGNLAPLCYLEANVKK